jgi:hypothetical protein
VRKALGILNLVKPLFLVEKGVVVSNDEKAAHFFGGADVSDAGFGL